SLNAFAASYPQPYIASFSPNSGVPGTVVKIQGSGFSGLNKVLLSGTSASFKVMSDGSMSFVVPGKAKSGQIELANPAKAAWSGSNFFVKPSPTPTPKPSPTPAPYP